MTRVFPQHLLKHHYCSQCGANSDPEPSSLMSGYGTATSSVYHSDQGDSSDNFSVSSDPELQIALNMDLAEQHGAPVAMAAENNSQEALSPENGLVGENETQRQPSVKILDRNRMVPEEEKFRQSSQVVSGDSSDSQELFRYPPPSQDQSVLDHSGSQELVSRGAAPVHIHSNIGSRSRELGARPKCIYQDSSAGDSGNTVLKGRAISLPAQSLPIPNRSPVLPREPNLAELYSELEDR